MYGTRRRLEGDLDGLLRIRSCVCRASSPRRGRAATDRPYSCRESHAFSTRAQMRATATVRRARPSTRTIQQLASTPERSFMLAVRARQRAVAPQTIYPCARGVLPISMRQSSAWTGGREGGQLSRTAAGPLVGTHTRGQARGRAQRGGGEERGGSQMPLRVGIAPSR